VGGDSREVRLRVVDADHMANDEMVEREGSEDGDGVAMAKKRRNILAHQLLETLLHRDKVARTRAPSLETLSPNHPYPRSLPLAATRSFAKSA